MDTWQDLTMLMEGRLAEVTSGERKVFAADVAERLLTWHEALPEDDQVPFTLSLRPLLDSVWEGVLGDTTAFSAVKQGVAEYMLSEYCHNDGQDGPDDADEPAAAAVLHAAHAYLFGCSDFALWAGRRAMEAIDQRLEYLADQDEDADLPDSDEAMAAELQRQLRDLDLIAGHAEELRHSALGLPVDASIRLRAELRTPLSSQD
ncbi:hypothetical protein ACIRPK_33835 [Kitasatospora sp. NPDC101801]|uniref:hypothetical protein n=1 Tax=Kitasatospora sp. NPDC101801 TaxID=3364103 RepID=UPI00382C5CC5